MNDLTVSNGADNLGGLVDYAWLCAVDDIASVPALASAASLLMASGNIANVTGKKFTKVQFTDDTGKVEVKSVGPDDAKSRQTILTGIHPMFGTELEDFISDNQNLRVVIIYRLKRNGKLYVMGLTRLDKTSTVLSLANPARFNAGDVSSGDKSDSQPGGTLGWIFRAHHGPIQYIGTVPLTPAP